LIARPSDFARSALYYVQKVGHFYTQAPYFTEREGIVSFLVIYTASGSGSLSYADKTYKLTGGYVFFIDCMTYHISTTQRT